MKASLTLQNFRAAVGVVQHALAKATPLEVLHQIRVEAKGDALTFCATDGDQWAICRVPADVEKPGVQLVHGPTLVTLTSKLRGPMVALEYAKSAVTLKSGAASVKLTTSDVDAFPTRPEQDQLGDWTMTGRQIASIAARIPWAVSVEDSRPTLQGVRLELKGGKLDAVATSGHVIALQTVEVGPTASDAHAMLEPDSLKTAARIFSDAETVDVVRYPAWIGFQGERSAYLARLRDSDFPNYRQVLGSIQLDRTAVVDRAALLRAVDVAEVVAVETTNRIRFDFGEDEVLVHSQRADRGEGEEPVPIEYKGAPLKIAFNADYVRNILQRMPTDRVSIELGGQNRPAIVRPVWDDAPEVGELLMLSMPLRYTDTN